MQHPHGMKIRNLLSRVEFFSSLLGRRKHMSHRVFCVANIKATVARETYCICLGCRGAVNLHYRTVTTTFILGGLEVTIGGGLTMVEAEELKNLF